MAIFKLRSSSLFAVLMSLSAVTHAQPYVSFGLGHAKAELPLDGPFNGIIDDREIMYGIDGGWSLNHRWAAEAGINRYGGFDGRGTPCTAGQVCPPVVREITSNDISVLKLAVVPRVNIGDVQVFGKGGVYRARIDANTGLPDSEFRETGVLLGAGLRWYFEEPWSISVEAERFDDKLYQLRLGIGWGLRRNE
jgi:hypothetical protein